MGKLFLMKNVEKNKLHSLFKQVSFSVFVLFFPAFCFAQDSIISNNKCRLYVHGYVKDLQSAYFIDNSNSLITGNLIHNRINLRLDLWHNLYFRLEARNRLYYGEQVKTTYQFGKYIDKDNGQVDFSYNLIDDTSIVLNAMLDRILIDWSTSKWDITLGRQRINWGINLVWNPNDIFNAYNYFDFDYEERPGTDAVRIQYNAGRNSCFDLSYKLSDKKKEQIGALMYRTNFRKYDLQEFAGVYYEDIVVGTGWAGSIKNTGFKGEASYFHPYKKMADTTGIFSGTVSFDRSFKNNYFALVSYLYNSGGRDAISGMNELTGNTLSAKNLIPFKHSFFFQVNKSFNPLVNGSIACIFSPKNNSFIFLPSLAVSVSDNWDVSLVGQSFFSDVRGVYRTLGNGVFLRLRWSY